MVSTKWCHNPTIVSFVSNPHYLKIEVVATGFEPTFFTHYRWSRGMWDLFYGQINLTGSFDTEKALSYYIGYNQ